MSIRRKIIGSVVALLALGIVPGRLGALDTVPDLNLGGSSTVFEKNSQAFSLPFATLSGIERLQFQAGDALFTEAWVASPSSTSGRDGLGPLMVTRACANCHLSDGRGAPPVNADEEPLGLLIRLSSQEAHAYGEQIQNRAVLGAKPEASVKIDWIEHEVGYPDGTSLNLRSPNIRLENLAYGPLPADILMSARLAPQVIGLGLIDAISPETILEWADPDDKNQDGISGKPNYVFSQVTKKTELGRFGWKANQASLEDQDAAAFNGDMGLTSTLFPSENCTAMESVCSDLPNGGSPEVVDKQMKLVVHYSRFLAVPARRNTDNEDVKRGREVFFEAKCDSCHRPTMTTAQDAVHPLLSNQTIWPYTDVLLHDMGPELADNRPDGLASGSEWRTPPLWGVGLATTINGHGFYMHDGRARSLEEAIMWHGGEGEASREHFKALPVDQRKALLQFLNSL